MISTPRNTFIFSASLSLFHPKPNGVSVRVGHVACNNVTLLTHGRRTDGGTDGLYLGWERGDGKLREGLTFLQNGKKCKRIRYLLSPCPRRESRIYSIRQRKWVRAFRAKPHHRRDMRVGLSYCLSLLETESPSTAFL